MLLQVDVIKQLIKNRVTADQFLVTQYLYTKEYEEFSKYLSLYNTNEKDILFKGLAKAGLAINMNPEGEYNPEFIQLQPYSAILLATENLFDQLLEVYPIYIIRPDGTKDYLRTDVNRCRVVYTRITKGKEGLHSQIMDCLRYELAIRKKEGSMRYMKRLPKWLVSEEWKVYDQRMKDDKETNIFDGEEDVSYGTSIE